MELAPHKLEKEIARRRTFAIISHPDAGKTTLTEKLLLYGGALNLAGSVRARRNQASTASDWMELEKERGISVSATVLQFDYAGHVVNLLDTPGHRDFSEDTYRVLTAVDSVVMVIDAAKGIEERTRKLFEICRLRHIPIFTFINKMDRPAQDPLTLVDEIEKVLGIGAFPVTWPVGSGQDFRGVYDRLDSQVYLFEQVEHGKYKAPFSVTGIRDEAFRTRMPAAEYEKWIEEVDILSHAGENFCEKTVRKGLITPVFFGSAINNFGVQHLLDYFVRHGAPPAPRNSSAGVIEPMNPAFSGFVFKVQANMNPRHRDSLAFLRIVSGVFEKDIQVPDPRSGKDIRLAYPQRMFGQERETVEVAYPGDIVGLVSHGSFRIGDTLTTMDGLQYHEIPRFPPEVFGYLRNPNPSRFKQFKEGLDQLLAEGVIQVFHLSDGIRSQPLLGAVGPLQFDVVQYRLKSEYGSDSRFEPAAFTQIRWLATGTKRDDLKEMVTGSGVQLAEDAGGELVVLFPSPWSVEYFTEKNPALGLRKNGSGSTDDHRAVS
ncbi:MAG: peptide chain release factor 3 [Verrucomicrobia bacterium]|nr:peptide chain release factor 3 [Verrucomicrobiota bacterium]